MCNPAFWRCTAGTNTVRGNYIGTLRSGNSRLETLRGIRLVRSGANTIAGNVIGAVTTGIAIEGDGDGNVVQANHIGVGADGSSVITPGTNVAQHGVWVLDTLDGGAAHAPQGTLMGGSAAQGNLIAHWGGNAVRVQRQHHGSLPLRRHAIQGNRIWGTAGLGVELIDTATSEGAVPTDPAPQRVNNGTPTPELTAATGDGGSASVGFALAEGVAHAAYEFELFANAACHPQGFGAGQTSLARFSASTDGTGRLNGTANVPAVAAGTVLTLAATRHGGPGMSESSEFSACRTISGGAAPGTPPAIGTIPNDQLAAVAGQPYTLALAAHTVLTEGDPIQAWALQGALPAWLSFDAATGVLSGTPGAVGSHTLSATARDKDGTSAPRGFVITVAAAGQGGGGNGSDTIAAVPTLGHAGLALLSLLVGAAGWRRTSRG